MWYVFNGIVEWSIGPVGDFDEKSQSIQTVV